MKAFAALFTQALGLCAQAGLVSLGRVALDGSKVRASASRHRAMSYDRMVRAEGELAAEVRALLADAERADAAEDAVHGDRRGDELPAELARGPVRGLKTDRTASVVIQGHAFVQNLRRGHYELGIDAAPVFRLATAFDELQLAI